MSPDQIAAACAIDDTHDRPLERGQSACAAAAVPEALRHIGMAELEPWSLAEVDADRLPAAGALAAHRPAWIGACHRPARPRLEGAPRRTLMHRGRELEALYVWGADDRRVYADTRYPWGCVCRVVTAAGTGSGVIVGPRHVLTASHVVDWARSGAGTVEVHRAGPAASALSAIRRVWTYIKVAPPQVGHSEVDEDYAVLVTADRIGERFGWLGVRTYNSGWDDEPLWYNIGYPRDVADGAYPVWQNRKSLDEDEWDYGSARAMTTSADTARGQSGGPIFGFWRDGPSVVATVSAQGTYFLSGRENWCSGGTALTRLVNHARAQDA